MLKLKRLKTSATTNAVVNYCLQTVKIETVVDNNLSFLYIEKQNGNQGYTQPIYGAVSKKNIKKCQMD